MTKLEMDKDRLGKLINLSADISERSPLDAKSLVFMARPFVQTTLPHRDPGEVPEWHRKNGRLTLSIRPGWAEDPKTGLQKPIGIPFGSLPRLLLFWMTTEALKTNERVLELGKSLSEFMTDIGLDPRHGGKKSDLARLKDQMNRLLRSTISIDENTKEGNKNQNRWLDMQVVFQGKMSWFDTNDNRFNADNNSLNTDIEGSWIELTEIFFKSITHSAVPLDMRIIQEIKQSPLALDIYAWLTHRTFGYAPIESSRAKPSFISWKQLHDQFGSNYTCIKKFKQNVKPILSLIQSLSRNTCIEQVYGGVSVSQKITRIK